MRFVIEGAWPALTGLGARVGVDTELEAFGVDGIGQRLDPMRKARAVGDDYTARVTRRLPAIVDDHVAIAGVAHAARGDRIRLFADELIADIAAEVVPAVPPHRGRTGEAVLESRGRGFDANECERHERRSGTQGGHAWRNKRLQTLNPSLAALGMIGALRALRSALKRSSRSPSPAREVHASAPRPDR